MNKPLLLKILIRVLQMGSLVSGGAGAFLLFSGGEKVVRVWAANDAGGKIVKSSNSMGEWTFVKKYQDSNFSITCHGDKTKVLGEDLKECERHIETKSNNKQPIYLSVDKNISRPITGWDKYKFTFDGEVEEGKNEYWGQCFPENVVSAPEEDPCRAENLPDGWTKVKDS